MAQKAGFGDKNCYHTRAQNFPSEGTNFSFNGGF
jgi:hypothetical protein